MHSSSILAILSLATFGTAVSITNCNNGRYTNYGEAGNNKCKNFITDSSVAYDSNKGLTLTVFSASDCNGESFTTRTQNECVNVPFIGQSVRAG